MTAHRPRDGRLRPGCTAHVNVETNRQRQRRHCGAVRTKGTICAAPRTRPPEVSLHWDHAEPTRPTRVARDVGRPRGDALPLVNPLFVSLIVAIALLLCLLVADLLHPARTDSDGTGVGRPPPEHGHTH